MVCSKCQGEFSNTKEVVKCSECSSQYHPTCCRIRTATKLAGMSAKAMASWRCDECVQDSASATSRSDTDDPTVLELLKNISKEMADSKKSNKESFASLEKSISFVHESVEEMKSKLVTVEAENANLKKECARLGLETQSLNREVKDLKRDMVEMQQYSRCSNVEIRGVPVTVNEDIYCVIASVARVIGVTFSRNDISIAHRLPTPRDRRFHPSIVVQFVSRTTRATWIAAAKDRKPTTRDLAASLAPGPIYVGDHLIPHNRELLRRAKSHVRVGRLAYAWAKDGKIFVRQHPDSPACRVWSIGDLTQVIGPPPRGHDSSAEKNAEDPPRTTTM